MIPKRNHERHGEKMFSYGAEYGRKGKKDSNWVLFDDWDPIGEMEFLRCLPPRRRKSTLA